MQLIMEQCWICGADADTGEHIIKASDLRATFGHVDQASPIYMHIGDARNKPIKGLKSDRLKYSSRLCATCNNQRTQKHDRAWSKLSTYLRERKQHIKTGDRLNIGKIFPGSVRSSMLNVHLFFLKHFGCLITENEIPLDIQEFASCINNNHAHPNVHIAFWKLEALRINHIGRSHVETAVLRGQIAYAGWFYILEHIAVNIQYALPTERRKGLTKAWHPSSPKKFIHIA